MDVDNNFVLRKVNRHKFLGGLIFLGLGPWGTVMLPLGVLSHRF